MNMLPFRYQRETEHIHLRTEFTFKLIDLQICKFLFENGVDLSPSDNNRVVPLHSSARQGHLEVCKFLLENGSEKNPRDDLGFTPLHSAAQNGHVEVIKILASYVENKNPMDNIGRTPFTILNNYLLNNVFNP